MYGHPMSNGLGWAALQRARHARRLRRQLALCAATCVLSVAFLIVLEALDSAPF